MTDDPKTFAVRFWSLAGGVESPADRGGFFLDHAAVARAKAEAFGPKAVLVGPASAASIDPVALLREACAAAGGQAAWAARHGVDEGSFSRQLSGRRPVSDWMLAALGLERVVAVTYRRRA